MTCLTLPPSSMSFDTIPSQASLKPRPFTAHVSDKDLESFQTLLKHSRIGPKTYENLTADVKDFTHFVLSLPGYGYSNGPPLDKDFDVQGIARMVDILMVGLGFGGGYISQGGDISSFVSRVLAVNAEACKAVHLHHAVPIKSLSQEEQKGLERYNNFNEIGNAYAREHGTRLSTIGLVLPSSPVALLAWVGEKFLQWSDTSPPLTELLVSVSLYWFTNSFPRAIYPYRQFFGSKPSFFHPDAEWHIKKPMGYSWHPKELAPVPKDWVAKSGNLVWYRGAL
ncbi:hypothetical protein LTS10_003125 [Elasticomyces elasticus]|nr:hypothetical protein LTS10_003125 [Elasticomyces elasticus]